MSRKGYGLIRVGEFETLFCAIINTEGAYQLRATGCVLIGWASWGKL